MWGRLTGRANEEQAKNKVWVNRAARYGSWHLSFCPRGVSMGTAALSIHFLLLIRRAAELDAAECSGSREGNGWISKDSPLCSRSSCSVRIGSISRAGLWIRTSQRVQTRWWDTQQSPIIQPIPYGMAKHCGKSGRLGSINVTETMRWRWGASTQTWRWRRLTTFSSLYNTKLIVCQHSSLCSLSIHFTAVWMA